MTSLLTGLCSYEYAQLHIELIKQVNNKQIPDLLFICIMFLDN